MALFFDGALVDVVDAGSLPPDHSLARTAEADWRVRGAARCRGTCGREERLPDEPTVPRSSRPPRPTSSRATRSSSRWPARDPTLQDLNVRLGCPTLTPSIPSRVGWSGPRSADGGRYDVVVEVKPTDEPAKPETAWATVWVADAIDDPLNVAPFPSLYQEEWGVPVLHVEHEGALSESYIPMVTHLRVPWSGTIKKRGAASLWYPKNNYTLEFEPDQIDMSELGCVERTTWSRSATSTTTATHGRS